MSNFRSFASMTEKEIQFRKKRETGEIISDTFEFLKQEYKSIFSLVGTYVLPFFIMYAVVEVYLQKNVISRLDLTDTESLLANVGPVYLNFFIFSLFGLFVQSMFIATYYSYLEVYIKKGKGNFTLADVKPLLFSNGLLALGAGLTYYLLFLLGLMLCIVPGIYFANTFSLVAMILIFEKRGLSNAMLRSVFLVKQGWWNTFLLNVLGLAVIWVAGLLVSIPAFFSGISESIFNPGDTPGLNYPQWYWILLGITAVISSFLWIIPYTFLAFQYFNLEEQAGTNFPPLENTGGNS